MIDNKKTNLNGKKLFIKTFGCQMNEYDSNKMADILNEFDGYELTDVPEDADVALLNTCSIREKAQEKVFSDLGRLRKIKAKNPNLIIGVGGCVASQEGDNIIKRAPYVDIVFGPQTLHRIPELMQKKAASGKPQVDISFPEIEKFDSMPEVKVDGITAFVSIMEGCSKYCSFCVVPYTRGEEISRPFDDVMREVINLSLKGVREVNLLGQNVNAYRGIMSNGEIADFAMLLQFINDIPDIARIRFTTSHPKEMNSRIINCFATLPKLVSHLHLPAQSGSDRVLSAMKRGYTSLEYKSIMRKIRAIRPDISFSSDFIVGFPGETEEEFEKTMKLIEDITFDISFSFIYSPRPGTPASELVDETPQAVKLERLQRLQAKINAMASEISANMVGKTYPILVESNSKKNDSKLMGRAENNKIVHFVGNSRLIGQIVNVRILEALSFTLNGELEII